MDKPIIEEIHSSSASEFFDLIRPSNDIWWDSRNQTNSPWFFRGQWDVEWSILPKAWRPDKINPLAPLLNKFLSTDWHDLQGGYKSAELKNLREYIIRCGAEMQSIEEFHELAEKIDIHTSGPINSFDRLEKQTIPMKPRTSGSPLWPENKINTDHAPLAQHHGIPTRLLDWTESPLIAAHFATAREYRSEKPSEKICVFAYNDIAFNSKSGMTHPNSLTGAWIDGDKSIPGIKLRREYKHLNNYQRLQKGLFTEIVSEKEFFELHGRWPTLEEVIKLHEFGYNVTSKPDGTNNTATKVRKIKQTVLRKLTLPTTEADAIVKLLEREKISQVYLMPTLDRVGKTIVETWENN